jgi:AP endonuclease-1
VDTHSGEIGLNTFSFIVHDPRMQDLPLILETPTFEQPEVWAHEIEMLNKLSSLELDASEERQTLVKELKEVLKKAQTSSGKGTKSGGKKSPAKKRKKKTGGDEEDDASDC